MTINYASKEAINLQDAARDLDARLKALEPKSVEEPIAANKPAVSKTAWTPAPPKA